MKIQFTSRYKASLKLFTALFVLPFFIFSQANLVNAADETEDGNPLKIDGYLSLKYIGRSTKVAGEEFDDSDLFTKFRFDITRPKDNLYEFHFFGVNKHDMDGRQDETGFYPFEEISDTQDYYTKIYEAHFDLNNQLGFKQIRLGRQYSSRGEWVVFDGLKADMELNKNIDFTVYGGSSVHFDEKYSETDIVGGLGVDYSPIKSAKLYFDLLSFKDLREHRKETEDQNDQLLSFKYWQRISQYSKVMTKLRWINGKPRDIKINSANTNMPGGIDLSLVYFRQLRTQNELSNEISSLYDILGQSRPYHSVNLKASKFFNDNYVLDFGYFQRKLMDSDDESSFNRNYKRFYSVFEMYDIFNADGLSLSFTMERWDSSDYNGNTNGFDVEYKFGAMKKMQIQAGSYFSLYQYDDYSNYEEETQVRVNFVKFKVPIGEHYCLKGEYEIEKSIEDYQTFKLELRRDF